MVKYLAIAAAVLVSSNASAQSFDAGRHSSAATARRAVLDNIMGRVQMDALISNIVANDTPQSLLADAAATGDTKVNRERRAMAVAVSAPAGRPRG